MLFSRNLGLITQPEQDQLSCGCVLIAGVGGMGGVAAEVLVRMGVGHIKLCDHDFYEEVNFNRQLHANHATLGKYKVEVLKKEFLKINPDLKISVSKEGITENNVSDLLDGVSVVINGMDKMFASLILERAAREKNKTIVDAWLTPYASVFVMTPRDPHWEEFMDLPTFGVPLSKITPELCKAAVAKEIEYTFSHFSPYDIIDKNLVADIIADRRPRPSLAPVVWLSGVLMANETYKILAGKKHTDYAGIFFNQYDYELMRGQIPKSVVKKVA